MGFLLVGPAFFLVQIIGGDVTLTTNNLATNNFEPHQEKLDFIIDRAKLWF